MKRLTTRRVTAAVLALVFLFIVVTIVVIRHERQRVVHTKVEYSDRYRILADRFAERYPSVVPWWLPDDSTIATAVVGEHIDEINMLFTRYRDTNAHTQALYTEFESFAPWCVIRDPVKGFIPAQPPGGIFAGKHPIRFIPRTIAMNVRAFREAPGFYWELHDALHIHARPFPPKLLASMVYHEVAHWSLARARKAAGTRQTSDERDAEEVWVLEQLDVPVLDVATDGQYTALADAVLARRRSDALPPSEILDLITAADLEMLHRLVSTDGIDYTIGRGGIVRFELTVLFRYADVASRTPLATKLLYYKSY